MRSRSLRLALAGTTLVAGLPLAAAAQTATLQVGNAATNAAAARLVDVYSTYLNSVAGTALLQASLATVIAINNNATAAQVAQAYHDDIGVGSTSQMTGLIVADGLGPALASALDSAVVKGAPALLTPSSSAPPLTGGGSVYNAFAQAHGLTSSDADFVKYFIGSGAVAVQSVPSSTGTVTVSLPPGGTGNVSYRAYLPAGSVDPNSQGDPRPYQVSTRLVAYSGYPYAVSALGVSGAYSSKLDVNDPSMEKGAFYKNANDASFPSGHSTFGNTAALLFAVAVPERYQQSLTRGSEFQFSRNVLGVHYPLDSIAGRIISLHDVAQLLNGNPEYGAGYPATFAQATSDLRAVLAQSCGGTVAACAASTAGDRFANAAQNRADYLYRLTYGLPPVGDTTLAPVVPAGAEVLLATRFPYLSANQIRDVLASTELPSGVPLDDGTGWARLNLYDAASGYAALTGPVTVTMNAALGGFNALDSWGNDITGPGSLFKDGTGTLVLAGNDTYTGGTTVAKGTLVLTGTLAGSLTVNPGATFMSNGGYGVASGARLANAGLFTGLMQTGTLLNAGTVDNSGVLDVALTNTGSITNSGAITGAVSNAGTLANAGILAATLANTGTAASSGTVVGAVANAGTLSNSGTLGSTLSNTGTATNGGTVAGAVFNTGLLFNSGGLAGGTANSGYLANSGTLAGGLSQSGGSVVNTGTIAGGVTQTGGSILNSGMVSGGLALQSGSFVNNGAVAGTTVAYGRLSGTGTFDGTLVAAGIIAPGNSVGTMRVNGNVTFAPGSTYQAELGSPGQSDLIAATGTATIQSGARIQLVPAAGFTPVLGSYTVLTAAGGISGQFVPVADEAYPFLATSLRYGSTAVQAVVGRGAPIASAGLTPNQQAAGAVLDSLPDGNALVQTVTQLSYATAPAVLQPLSGSIYATVQTGLQQQSVYVRDAVTERLRQAAGADPQDRAIGFWQQGIGSWGGTAGDGNTTRLNRSTGGVLVGADAPVGSWRAGLVTGVDGVFLNTDNRAAKASYTDGHAGAYAGTRIGAAGVSFGAAYMGSSGSVSRSILSPSVVDGDHVNTRADSVQAFAEATYQPGWASGLQPFAKLAFVHVGTSSAQESGQVAALSVRGDSMDAGYLTLGVRHAVPFTLAGQPFVAEAKLGWQHVVGNTVPRAHLLLAGAPFSVAGVPLDRDQAVVGAGVRTRLASWIDSGLRYDGQYGGRTHDSSVSASLLLRF